MQLTWLLGAPSRPASVHRRAFGRVGLGSPATQLMRAVGRFLTLAARIDTLGVENMRLIRLSPYILLGSSVRYLLDVRPGMPVHEASQNELSLLAHLERVEIALEKADLRVARRAFATELAAISKALKKLPTNAKLSEKQTSEIYIGIKAVSDVLRYEGANLQAFVLSDKRLQVDKLLSDVSDLFGECVYLALPDIAQYDFAQAGKCIAFELPTAAAFHVLRGTESVLRAYHAALVASATTAPQMWGPTTADLRRLTADALAKELLDNLDNIRVSFRNPTQHPDKRYDIDEAQDVFNLCVEVVNRMSKDLFRRGVWQEVPF